MVTADDGQPLRIGTRVRIPWGKTRDIEGTVDEIWGDPPSEVWVWLHLPYDDDVGPRKVLLSADLLTPIRPAV